jgi:hypothetical protein
MMNGTRQSQQSGGVARRGALGRGWYHGLSIAAAVLSVWAAGCTKTTSISVSMEYKPTATVGAAGFPVTAGTTLFVEPVVDERSIKDRVGEYREADELSLPANAEGTPVPEFVHHALRLALAELGIKMVDEASSATRIMSVTLSKCWTSEEGKVGPTSVYDSEVRTAIKIADNSGAVLCEGLYSGSNSRFGGDQNEDNYQEGISDAIVDLVTRLGASAAFQKAVAAE